MISYGALLKESNRVVFEDYVLSNLSLSEIAKERDITRQGVYDIVKRCRTRLKGYEEKLHLIEKFQLTKDKLGEIESMQKKILMNKRQDRLQHSPKRYMN